MTRRPPGQDGSASVQVVLATPALLLMVMLVMQFALWQHASHVVTAAAQHGLTETQGEDGSSSAGRRTADRFLDRAGRGLVERPRITVTRTAERARVVVRARVVSLVPGLRLPLVGRANGPVERFVPPGQR